MKRLPIEDTYAGKHILLIGGSGFLGKVWLSMLFETCPNVGKVTVLLRKRGLRGAKRRLEKMINESYAFEPWHKRHGDQLTSFLAGRLEAVDGDLGAEGLGLDKVTTASLQDSVDIVINSAGLVDFDPDPRAALESNVEGPMRLLDFVKGCKNRRLVHVSTCYVAGNRQGEIPEEVIADTCPNGNPIDVRKEWETARALFDQMAKDFDTPQHRNEVDEEVQHRIERDGLDGENEALVRNLTDKIYRRKLEKVLSAAGTERATGLGFPNTYTWSKFLCEGLIATEGGNIEWTLLRPSIVESAFSYPRPGWVEGFKTSGPLIYLLGTWFRQLPARKNLPFDVIPVDMVCQGVFIAGAALIHKVHKPVYQTATSSRNRLTIGRSCELTALGHRKHLRTEGGTPLERLVLSRWDSQIEDTEPILSVPNIRKAVKGFGTLLKRVPEGLPGGLSKQARNLAKLTNTADRQLKGVERLMGLFKPFTTDNWQIYHSRALSEHPVEESAFHYAPEKIDWLPYWTDVHMPGLRRWSFPEMEGKSVERMRPASKAKLQEAATETKAKEGAA